MNVVHRFNILDGGRIHILRTKYSTDNILHFQQINKSFLLETRPIAPILRICLKFISCTSSGKHSRHDEGHGAPGVPAEHAGDAQRHRGAEAKATSNQVPGTGEGRTRSIHGLIN